MPIGLETPTSPVLGRWTPFLQKIFPEMMFWWWWWRGQEGSRLGTVEAVLMSYVLHIFRPHQLALVTNEWGVIYKHYFHFWHIKNEPLSIHQFPTYGLMTMCHFSHCSVVSSVPDHLLAFLITTICIAYSCERWIVHALVSPNLQARYAESVVEMTKHHGELVWSTKKNNGLLGLGLGFGSTSLCRCF